MSAPTKKCDRLAKKNEELIGSQKRADQIFSALANVLPGRVLDGKYQLEDKIGAGDLVLYIVLNTWL